MHARTFSQIQRQRGYTLMEILVAVAIFATVMIVALLLYDQSNRVFKQANESADMQQNTRVAFEKVVTDLRMAGFDYKRAGTPSAGLPSPWVKERDYSVGTLVIPTTPNGHVYRVIDDGKSGTVEPAWKTTPAGVKIPDGGVEWQESGVAVHEQPDEQIEYAHNNAITIRGNFDYEDPSTPDKGRETKLEESSEYHFPVVTTGNDEIVTYALVSRSGNANANKDTITFFADVNAENTDQSRTAYPGGNAEREIKIPDVDLTNKYPPYTLMRYTIDEKGIVRGTALADNIRSMEFKYWQDAAATDPLTDFDDKDITDMSVVGGLGKYDPNDKTNPLIKERLIRGRIRAITATIVGMNPQIDYDFTHPTDTVAPNYRQYALQSTIVGRNLGLKGMPQVDTNPPGPPRLDVACAGYCGVVFLTWSPDPASTGDATYTVLYDESPTGSFSNVLPAGSQTSYAVDLTQLDLSKTYYFRVAATNSAGTTLNKGDALAVSPKNAFKPKAPVIKSVNTTPLPSTIQIVWTPPTENTAGALPSCTPSGAGPQQVFASEIRGYRIYRSKDQNFDPTKGEGTLVLDETKSGISSVGDNLAFLDTTAANCETYWYRVAAVEWCAKDASYNTSGNTSSAISDYSVAFGGQAESKEELKAPTALKQTVDSVCDPDTNRCDPVTLVWEKVTKDVKEQDTVVDRYVIYRQTKLAGTNVGSVVLVGEITDGTTTFRDDKEKLLEHDELSGKQYTYEYTVRAKQCDVEGQPATLLFPGACATGATVVPDGTGPGSGTPDDPMQNVTSLTVVPGAKELKQVTVSVDGGTPTALVSPFVFGFDIEDGEVHRVTFTLISDCTEIINYYVQSDATDCAIRTTVDNIPGDDKTLELTMLNISDADIELSSFDLTWLGQTGFSWAGATLPSGTFVDAIPVPPATLTSPRTFTFVPTKKSDQTILKGASYTVRLILTGTAIARPAAFSNVRVDYTEVNVLTQFGCNPQHVQCTASATAVANPAANTIAITVSNSSTTESLTIKKFAVRWLGQNDWSWTAVNAGTSTIAISPAITTATTREFSPDNFIIPPESTGVITMTMVKTKNNAPTLAANIGLVNVEYTTGTSDPMVLFCRAKQ
jgi:prepilin-type N-terminal cleavage/methylation domain-containing protein